MHVLSYYYMVRIIDIFSLVFRSRISASVPLSSRRLISSSPPPSAPEINVNHKEAHIENLFEFLGLQSFDGKFLPQKSFYEFYYKNDLNDFINLKQEIEKEIDKTKEDEIEEILSTCIAVAYLEMVMFEKFKDECEMCHEKAERVLKKMIGDEEKEKHIVEKAKEWIKNWVNNNDGKKEG
ncbi:hypothetical protein C1645_133222 [Glomus cerebriforme]|uniref:Uncharacterized protein n=1 Tax=Glomus cerebriforme TaxID=658196 RepID=A0A397T7G8_9GLOM|nr:hypothetical protein C1645_133222 [Glomus cerebriforme]